MSSPDTTGVRLDALATAGSEPGAITAQEAAVSSASADAALAKARLEAAQKLAETATKLTEVSLKTLNTLERSSRWTLLFIAVTLGFLMSAAPYLLVMADGRFAATTAEYLTTSLSGGVLALAGLVGLIVADRGTRNAAVETFGKNIDVLDALRKQLDVAFGRGPEHNQIPVASQRQP